jgi:hypothetical protein
MKNDDLSLQYTVIKQQTRMALWSNIYTISKKMCSENPKNDANEALIEFDAAFDTKKNKAK